MAKENKGTGWAVKERRKKGGGGREKRQGGGGKTRGEEAGQSQVA